MFRIFTELVEFFHRARGRHVQLDLTPYQKLLARISQLNFEAETDDRLKERSASLIARLQQGTSLDDILIEGFTLVRESARRVLAMRPFDVQMLAGIAMHRGKLVEMQTGEGKTLAAVMPAYLNALAGQGVHVLTFNDYLARRDAQWMGPLYRYLGLTVGTVQEGMSPRERREAYASDVTYVTAKEAGFDYLRDHLCTRQEDLVHRPFHYAIVDEADSILIDEARVPLVIAGSAEACHIDPYRAAAIVRNLEAERHFKADEFDRNVRFTELGLDQLESELRCGSLHAPDNLQLLTDLSLALHARVLLQREVDYIVRDGRIELVDEFTGRVAQNRRWPDGLQAAVEAKEGVALQPQGFIRGSITLQHFLRLYPKIAGMTATAQPAAEELYTFYELGVVPIPPNRPFIRTDKPDTIFTHKEAKDLALVAEISHVHRTGRPVLVGTASVAESEHLAALLTDIDIECQVLNARNDEREAQIVAQAALPGAVTISTNMAGRGTDIKLGGDPPQDHQRVKVKDLGGLYVIGTNRHESRRIDDQLRGRAGRQGDPGESRFFISLEDDLIDRYGIRRLLPSRDQDLRQDEPVTDSSVHRAIARAQQTIERQTFEIRRTLWRYASLVENQRQKIHRRRQAILVDQEPLTLLATRATDRYDQLRWTVGDQILHQVEKQITLFQIDQCWVEYLVRVADIRDNIHLVVLGGMYDPLDEFHKMVGREFSSLLEKIDERIIQTFCSAETTEKGIDLAKEGLVGPSSTWTYLISDNPFGDALQRLLRGLKRCLADESDDD
ncbi:MAG: accessory Sec system translocase SecA2 [Pirellulales bacterium]|nr:accessory Sec system translocase SecA2 [Pirellulales bacterium]